MPETFGERLIFVAGLLLIGLLIAAIVYRPKSSDPVAARSIRITTAPTTTAAPPPPQTTTAPSTSTESSSARTTTATTTRETTASVALKVTARDDTWVSIRRTSATGPVLFEGTLAKGDSRSYTATQFHVRFGAAANVAATLNGKALALPSGTYSATIDRSGLGPRSA